MITVYTDREIERFQHIDGIYYYYYPSYIKIKCDCVDLEKAIKMLNIKNETKILNIENKNNSNWILLIENYNINKYANTVFFDELNESVGDIKSLGNYELFWGDITDFENPFTSSRTKIKRADSPLFKEISTIKILNVVIEKKKNSVIIKGKKRESIIVLELWSHVQPLPNEDKSFVVLENGKKYADISNRDKREVFDSVSKLDYDDIEIHINLSVENIFKFKLAFFFSENEDQTEKEALELAFKINIRNINHL